MIFRRFGLRAIDAREIREERESTFEAMNE
jgi:hypothetical protein